MRPTALTLAVAMGLVAMTSVLGTRANTSRAGAMFEARVQSGTGRPAQQYFTDVVLVNQDGKEMRLYSDLLKDKIVVINSFFSSCTDSCPAMNATIARIQERLGDRVGRDVYLISISVDPETDTPQVLKQYSMRFKARPGWYFLTGKKENVEFALKKLGQYVNEKQDHLNLMIIGNERTGLWKKAFGLARPDEIFAIVQSVLSDKS